MIVIPRCSRPKKFIKRVNVNREIVSVDFKINTIVKFDRHISFYYETKMLSNGSMMRIEKNRIDPEVSYGFQAEITISGDEYEKNRRNIESYVIEKIKERTDYQTCLKQCIEKEDADREYMIDVFVAKECNNPNLHYRESRTEEYIPQY